MCWSPGQDTKEIQIDMIETYSFGEWLKQRREQLRMTQRELASLTHCSVPMIKKIEADERHPSPELAELLAVTLKLPESKHAVFVEVARGERPVDLLWQVQEEASPAAALFHTPMPLPKPATPFLGRTDELAQVSERLSQPDCRLLTLVGPGGIGKTRLAIRVAQEHRSTFIEGVAFVSLASLTDSSHIPDAIARSLNLVLTGLPAEQVLAYLRRRSLLLILDNCEQLQGDLNWISELLEQSPGVKLLVTSRERLHLAEEWIFVVPGLLQAEALFEERARRVKQDFDAIAEHDAVACICQLVENLPLAIELAASWTPHMSCTQIADHIQHDINILATDVRNIPERHRSVQAVFDHSWNLLSAGEQDALMRLSVFRGGWRAPEALTVAGADLLVLRRLVDKSLVRTGENDRYELHELIRQLAAQKLQQAGHENETRQLHVEAYRVLAAQLDVEQGLPPSMQAVIRFDQEQDNFRAALSWSLDREQTEQSLDLLDHLTFYWLRRGAYREGSEWLLRAISQAGDLESIPLCAALNFGSTLLGLQGRYAEAEDLAVKGMAMARRLEEPEALILGYISFSYASVSTAEALQGLHEAIRLITETGKLQHFLAPLHILTATWFHSSGRYAEASAYYRKGIALLQQLGATDATADPLGRLGQLMLQEGRLQEAYDLTLESAEVARSMGAQGAYAESVGVRLGLIELYLGRLEAAENSVQQALQLYDDASLDSSGKLEALAIFSEVALARGEVKTAADRLQASLNICRTLFHQLQATKKLEGTPDALPVDIISLSARAALVIAAQGDNERATTLYSLADSFCVQSGQAMLPPLQARLDEMRTVLRARLPAPTFRSAWEAGQTLSLAQAFEFLLA